MKKSVFVDEINAKFILETLPNVAREIVAASQVPPAPRPGAQSWGALEEAEHKAGVMGVVARARQGGATEAQAAALLEQAIAERAAARDAVELAVKHGVVA